MRCPHCGAAQDKDGRKVIRKTERPNYNLRELRCQQCGRLFITTERPLPPGRPNPVAG